MTKIGSCEVTKILCAGSEQLAGDQVPIWCFGSKKETPSTDGWAGIFKSLGYGLSFIREMSDLGVQIRTHAYLLATYSLIKSHSIREQCLMFLQ